MTEADLVLYLAVGLALAFAFTNGVHDCAHLVAASVSTRAMAPRAAVLWAALLSFAGALVSLAVALTVVREIVVAYAITPTTVFAALAGAITWNVATLAASIPSSSSHALIGGLVGATLAAAGTDAVRGGGLVGEVLVPALLAPLAALVAGGLAIVVAYRVVARERPGPATRGFRVLQVGAGGLLAFAHGSNDGQKTMGVVAIALVAGGQLGQGAEPPAWVVLATAAAIALGTWTGGRRATRPPGSRIVGLDAAQGFSSQSAGAAVALAGTAAGYPLATTHVIAGGVAGAGAGRRPSATRWRIARNVAGAWLLAPPAAAALGVLFYGLARLPGSGAAGPVAIALLGVCALGFALARRGPAKAVDG